jgi:hypothetical protein
VKLRYPLMSTFFGLCKTTKSIPVTSSSPKVILTLAGNAFSIAMLDNYVNLNIIHELIGILTFITYWCPGVNPLSL